MSAFNRRLQPKEISGLPMVAVVGAVAVLVFGVLTVMLPWSLRVVTAPLTLLAGAVAVAGFYLGDEWPLLPVMLAARRERARTTRDTWTRH